MAKIQYGAKQDIFKYAMTVNRIFDFTGSLACDPQVMIHATQAAALLSAARTYGFVVKIVMCAATAVVALLGDFTLVRVLAVLLGVYHCGALAVNRGNLLGLRTCPGADSDLPGLGESDNFCFGCCDAFTTRRVRLGSHCPPVHSSSKLQQQTERVRV